MPHGIFPLATPKNDNIYCLLSEQPSSHDFHATSCDLLPFSDFCTSTKSTRCNLTIWQDPAFLHLASHPKILAQVFMPEIDFWLGITLTHLVHITKGANTSSRVLYLSPRLKGTNASSGTLSPFMICFSRLMLRHQVFTRSSHLEQIQCFLTHITSS